MPEKYIKMLKAMLAGSLTSLEIFFLTLLFAVPLDLLFAFGRIDSFGCPLADIACAVELGALPTIPQMVELYSIAFECGGCEFFWNDGIAASYSRESRCLRVAVELDGHLSCSFYLIY